MTETIEYRQASEADYPQLHKLNVAALPHVNDIDVDTFKRLHGTAISLEVAVQGMQIAGFLLAMDQNADYESLNFQWFHARYPQFAYVDRIIVAEQFRRRSIAESLYQRLIARLSDATPVLTCEVNLSPPNPGSIAFHQRLGFAGVDEQSTEGGNKRVLLMARSLSAD